MKADLFTLSYFVSEVYNLDDGTISKFWETLFSEALPGAIFLYVDNGHETFNDYFDEQWSSRSDIEELYTVDNKRFFPRFTEQKSELDLYREKFGEFPKIESWISMRLLRKKDG